MTDRGLDPDIALFHGHHPACGYTIEGDWSKCRCGADTGAEERLRAALDAIREVCKPMSMTMQGPVWFDGGTPAGGGSRERIWRICDVALSGGSVDEGTE